MVMHDPVGVHAQPRCQQVGIEKVMPKNSFLVSKCQ